MAFLAVLILLVRSENCRAAEQPFELDKAENNVFRPLFVYKLLELKRSVSDETTTVPPLHSEPEVTKPPKLVRVFY